MAGKDIWRNFLTLEETIKLKDLEKGSKESAEIFQNGWRRYRKAQKERRLDEKLYNPPVTEDVVTMENMLKSKLVGKLLTGKNVKVTPEKTDNWLDFASQEELDVVEALGKHTAEYQAIKSKCMGRLYYHKKKNQKS
jgi:hypothetical protein